MKRKRLWLIAVLVIFVGVYSCTSSESEKGDPKNIQLPALRENLIIVSPELIEKQLDSSKTTHLPTMNVLNQIQEGLVRYNEKNEIVPGLAKEYFADPQQKVYTFHIRPEATWSDGKPITAEDFRYAWLKAIHPNSEFPYPNLFYYIQNAQAYKEGKVKEKDVGIKVLDDHTLQVTLNYSFPDFPRILTNTAYFPLRKDIVEAFQEEYGTSPHTMVYSGPFKVKAFSSESVTLIPNERYWDRTQVKVGEVKINVERDSTRYIGLYENNNVDILKPGGNLFSEFSKSPEMIDAPSAEKVFVKVNLKDPVLANKNVRMAIQKVLDKILISNLTQSSSKPTDRLLNVQPPGNHENLNIQTLLEQGLTELGKEKSDIELTLLVEDDPKQERIAQSIADQLLQKLQIRTKIVKLPILKQKREEVKGAYDLSLTSWLSFDSFTLLENWYSKTPYNTSHYANPRFDQLLDQAKQEPDPNKQLALLSEAERILVEEDAAVIPLYFSGNNWLQKQRVKGVAYHPFGPEYTLKWVRLEPIPEK